MYTAAREHFGVCKIFIFSNPTIDIIQQQPVWCICIHPFTGNSECSGRKVEEDFTATTGSLL